MCGLNKTKSVREDFQAEVFDIVKKIPAGQVLTYGQIARLAGKPQYSRLVGQILSHMPENHSLPCHRVVNSIGRLVPHWPIQRQLLEKEGVTFKSNGCVNLKKYLWQLF